MLFDGGMPPFVKAADMTGDSIVFIEALNGCCGDADIDLFLDQLMGDTVVMPIHLNVVIDVDPGFLPFCKLIGCLRLGPQCRFING